METKIYNSPEISLLETEKDIITTSDILSGLETPPTDTGSGSWETL